MEAIKVTAEKMTWITLLVVMDAVILVLFVGFVWLSLRFEGVQKLLKDYLTNGDGVTDQRDGKKAVALAGGVATGIFTANITIILITFRTIDTYTIGLIVLFVGITFSLLDISWRNKP